MPISFSCACGKAFRVKDEMAGKRARCPQCQGEVIVPLVTMAPAASNVAPAIRSGAVAAPRPAAPAFTPPPPPLPVQNANPFGYAPQPMPGSGNFGFVPPPPAMDGFAQPMQQANPFFLGAAAMPSMNGMPGDFAADNAALGGYGMPQANTSNPYQSPSFMTAAPVKKKKKASKASSSGGESMFNAGVGLGILMLIGSVVWFGCGLAAGYIFFYPPILFIAGLVSIGKGMMNRD